MRDSFWIGINTPSSKNNRQWTGQVFIASKNTQKWRKYTDLQWKLQKEAFLEVIKDLPKPLNIEFTFIRKGRHRFDYINMAQIMQDAMKYHGWIADDDADNLKPYFGNYIYDKSSPGCLIRVLKTKPIYDL